MNKQEVINQIKELIETKEALLEGDELDLVYEHDIEVLNNALMLIEELSREEIIYKKGGK